MRTICLAGAVVLAFLQLPARAQDFGVELQFGNFRD